MENTSIKTTFWKFIKDYQIEIPIIQRDYAQGRFGKENLRKGFLSDLKLAIEMKLDFVYGSTSKGKLYPLDGQQRLTTLWLLHWYIALRAGVLNNERNRLKNFSYETRISSREFCTQLCNSNFEEYNGNNIVDFITCQTWFYSAWKQDPTIQSMLRMLGGTTCLKKNGKKVERTKMKDGIEDFFSPLPKEKMIEYWRKLKSDDCPIVFYYLPLDNFGLSDDLYIKMNARGKQLTSFENFKADLIGYIQRQVDNNNLSGENREKWKELLDPQEGIPIKIDTRWTDIFWNNKSIGIKQPDGNLVLTNQVDEIYFAFINRFFWNELLIATDKNENGKHILELNGKEKQNQSYQYLNDEKENKNDFDEKIAYQGLDTYRYHNGEIPLECFQKLATILERIYQYKKELPNCPWNPSFRFIPEYEIAGPNGEEQNIKIINNSSETILKVTTLNQVQRIAFFAICKYFNDGKADEQSLTRWMRVVWNLISGEGPDGHPQIRSIDAVRSAIETINKLGSHRVYESLMDDDAELVSKTNKSDFEHRYQEEVEKAKQILNGTQRKDKRSWEEIIIEAEKSLFFRGSIRFLITDAEGNITWDSFDAKMEKVCEYFDKQEVKTDYQVELIKKLVIQCDDWDGQLYNKQIFSPNSSTWKWILCSENWRRPIHNILTMELDQISITDTNNNSSIQTYLTPRLNDLPFDWMIKEIPEGRFRWIDCRLAYYKPYGREYILFDSCDFNRGAILNELSKEIKTKHRIGNSLFFKGWDVQFCYNETIFQWQGNNCVRIINNLTDCKPIIKDDSKDKLEEKWFCFIATSEMNHTDFKTELDKLIKNYTSTHDPIHRGYRAL